MSPSTHPPPKVPTPEPSDRTSSFAPGFWGVDPEVLTTVATTISLPFFSSSDAALKTCSMYLFRVVNVYGI